jgi:PAS domain S-box-containing protein
MTRILIVEDSPTQAELLRLVLEAEGFAVDAAADAEAALERFAAASFDLVISDIVMPGLSGYELCQRIKHHPQGQGVPVILLSTLSDPMDIIRGLECEADNFITKPYEPEQLIKRIRTVLENRELRSRGKLTFGVEVAFLGKTFIINSAKEQILDLLIATFEDIVRTNRGLEQSKAALAAAKEEIEEHAHDLERRVRERTAELFDQQQQLAQAQTIAHLGSWRIDARTNALEWSDEMYRIFGVAPDKMESNRDGMMAMVHPEDRPRLAALMRESVAQRSSFRGELRIIRRSGEERHCLMEGHCRVGGSGEVVALFGVCQDITEHARAEIAARESTARYEQLVETSPDGIIVHADDTIVFANRTAQQMVGAERAGDLVGKPVLEIFQPDPADTKGRRIAALTAPHAYLPPVEQKLLRRDGTVRDVEVSVSTFQYQGRPAIQEILRDVTERNSMERQLQHAQRMEAVGQLTGGMAHDFNNILAVIIGTLDALEDELAERPETEELAKEALGAALHGAALTKQLLAFSRRQRLHSEVIDLNRLVGSTTVLLRRTLGESIAIATVLADGLWPAEADPSQVESALVNLAINARDAMPQGGRLTIETANKSLDAQYAAQNAEVTAGDYVMLAVSDTGTGIAAEVLSRVFDPFFTTKAEGKGSGLGLSMVYGFAKQSGGHVKIYSEEGHGTTVRIYLPKAGRASDAADDWQRLDDRHLHGHGETVLVVEDNDRVRAVVVRQLASLGYRVLQAENAAAALTVLERQPVDLLFSDIVMPGELSAEDLARKGKALHPKLGILFTSGFAEAAVQHGSSLAFPAEILSKPYRKQDLARKLREVLRDLGGKG